MPEISWKIAEPAYGLILQAEADAVWLRSSQGSLVDRKTVSDLVPQSRLGQLLPTLIPQLLELGVATESGGSLRLGYSDYSGLEEIGIDAFSGIVEWAPFTLELSTTGALGFESLNYRYRFYLGSQPVYPQRLGCFVRRGDALYQLDRQAFALINTIDDFNALPAEKKKSAEAYIDFAEIKGLARGVGAEVDRFIAKQNVLVPSQVGVDVHVHDDGRLSFVPEIESVDKTALRQAFLQRDDIDPVYSLTPTGGGGVHIVLDENQRAALKLMQGIRRVGKTERAEVLRDPQAIFDGVGSAVDLTDFGPRVRGIGDFPFVSQPYLQRSSTGIFDDPNLQGHDSTGSKFNIGITCRYADDSSENVLFNSRGELLEFSEAARNALATGEGTVQLGNKTILVDAPFIRALDEAVASITRTPTRRSEEGMSKRRYLLIYTNESELEYQEKYDGAGGDTDLDIPASLKDPSLLKPHQRAGVAWLQRNFRLNRNGCLLADDMGLGKTLQVLTFLAWLIEGGYLSRTGKDRETGPWKPILIVAPIILLENETWINDMRTFFANEGALFLPWVTLRGSTLSGFRRARHQETAAGEPVLDLNRLLQYRVILTNYETIVNYQHSFAKLKDNLTVVVTDEAQEHKTPSTKISHALKSLSPKFRVACTGTPVETRLLDVWNIFDYLQPGQLLGSASEFRDKYEKEIETTDAGKGAVALDSLKDRLRYRSPDAFLLRREKTALAGLPKKHEHQLFCDLSDRQREWHMDLVNRVKLGGQEGHPLGLIHHLVRVYQHPALVPRYDPISAADAIATCPKLSAVITCLHEIHRKGEKALIFTRSLDMQQLLAGAIGEEFGIDVDIVNGATNRKGKTASAETTRKGIVRRFRDSEGFNVLILSPDVAGIGLTLVEANHVIHYGRWWNPAKESQATDRVYRIGQTKDVHVYYPICRDPAGAFETFDEKLDALISRRKSLARDFLAPMPAESELELELLDQVASADEVKTATSIPSITQEELKRMAWDRFEALVALLEKHQGGKVVLTPRTGDGGIDVISVHENKIRLLRCKHTNLFVTGEGTEIRETKVAIEGYRQKLAGVDLPEVLKPVLVADGEFTLKERREAEERDVALITFEEIYSQIQRFRCSLAEVEAMENERIGSMADLQSAISKLSVASN
jgi:SNF2 family DNA or RNA helicase